MKTVLVMRHAKSSWKAEDLPDHERPLNGRGRRDAPRMGRWIARRGLVPQRTLASTAVRAQTTARLAGAAFGDREPEAELIADLYLSGPASYVRALRSLDPATSVALIVGHNPDVEDLVEGWTGRPVRMPTAAVAVVRLDVDRWDALPETGGGTLDAHVVPREVDEP